MEPKIRGLVIELIEKFRADGRCDFAQDISFKLPTSIFANLLGMPLEQLPHILEMEHEFLRGENEDSRKKGADAIFAYIVEFIASQVGYGGDGVVAAMQNARDAARSSSIR
jgi:cytochrome P450